PGVAPEDARRALADARERAVEPGALREPRHAIDEVGLPALDRHAREDGAARHRVERAQRGIVEAVAREQRAADARDALHLGHHHRLAARGVALEAERVAELVEQRTGELG